MQCIQKHGQFLCYVNSCFSQFNKSTLLTFQKCIIATMHVNYVFVCKVITLQDFIENSFSMNSETVSELKNKNSVRIYYAVRNMVSVEMNRDLRVNIFRVVKYCSDNNNGGHVFQL